MAQVVTVQGNFCDHYHADVFTQILSGKLPLASLGRRLRLVCTSENTNNGHSDTCQRAYNFRDMVVSSAALIAFVNENWKELQTRPRIECELVSLVVNMTATISGNVTDNEHVSVVGFLCNTPAVTFQKVRDHLLLICRHGEGVSVADYHALLVGGVLSRKDLSEVNIAQTGCPSEQDAMAVIAQYRDWVLDHKAPLVHIPLTNSCVVSLVKLIMLTLIEDRKLPIDIASYILGHLFPEQTIRVARDYPTVAVYC
jgi:hypothetical protein